MLPKQFQVNFGKGDKLGKDITKKRGIMVDSEARIKEIRNRLEDISAPEWEIAPNIHCDPFVSAKGRGTFGRIADVSNSPADYGRGNMEFIANSPTDMRFLLEELDKAKKLLDEKSRKEVS